MGGTQTFRARTATIAAAGDFLIGATAEETLQNLVSAIENFTTNNDFVLNQLDFEIDGSQLIIRGRTTGNVLDQTAANAALATGAATANEANLTGAALSNGTDTGINAEGVVSPSFVGTIGGFTATFNAADSITASITVGSDTFTANITDTTPAANTLVRFNSDTGGFFDVQLAGGNGTSVANQSDADLFASRLNAAFSTLTFSQARNIEGFGTGQLAGGSARFASDDFSDVSVDRISVTDSATTGADAIVEVSVNGETFRSNGLGNSIGSDETITLRSISNANRFLEISNGNGGAIDLSNAAAATTFDNTLRTNFGLGVGNGALNFQIGLSGSSTLSVTINSATSDSLFDGATPNLQSQAGAVAAESVIDGALNEIGEIIAGIGSAQQRLDFAFSATQETINELDFARGLLADTDIPSESVAFANAVVQQQAAIAVIAQTQILGSNLLGLLER